MVGTYFVAHTVVDTRFDTCFVGKAWVFSVLALVHLEPSHRSSSSRCLLSSHLGVDMLCNPSYHALLI